MELLERGDDEQQEALSVLFRHRSEPVSLVISSTRVWQLTGWLEAVRDTNTANNRSVQIDGPLETHAIPFTPPKIIASNYPARIIDRTSNSRPDYIILYYYPNLTTQKPLSVNWSPKGEAIIIILVVQFLSSRGKFLISGYWIG